MSIEKYNFSDNVTAAWRADTKQDKVVLCNFDDEHTVLDKDDAIAIAKHFKLTEEDLK